MPGHAPEVLQSQVSTGSWNRSLLSRTVEISQPTLAGFLWSGIQGMLTLLLVACFIHFLWTLLVLISRSKDFFFLWLHLLLWPRLPHLFNKIFQKETVNFLCLCRFHQSLFLAAIPVTPSQIHLIIIIRFNWGWWLDKGDRKGMRT